MSARDELRELLNGSPRCDDCGSALGTIMREASTGDPLCFRCFHRRGDDLAAEEAQAIEEAAREPRRPPRASSAPDAGWLDGAAMDPAAVAAEPMPPLDGFPFLHAGSGVVVSGPTGGGRSSLFQACAYDAARAGLRVAYLGSEVTEPEFNARASDLAARRGDHVDDELRGELSRVRYLNLASVLADAWARPQTRVEAVAGRFDIVGIDPLSAVASALDLNFDQSNHEFVAFYDRLVQPVTAQGVTVVMLDNIGHAIDARSRAKGVSAKADRADLTMSCRLQSNPPALVVTARKVRTVRAAFQRGDEWRFDRDTQRVSRLERDGHDAGTDTFRPTHLMEKASRAIEREPGMGRNAVRNATGGKTDYVDQALNLLIGEGYVEARQEGQARRHYSVRPYRENTEPGPGTHRDPTGTQPGPGPSTATGTPGPIDLSMGPEGPGAMPDTNGGFGGEQSTPSGEHLTTSEQASSLMAGWNARVANRHRTGGGAS